MIARYVQKGDSIDYRPAEPVAAGDVIVLNDMVGIARLDIGSGMLGSLFVSGVYDIAKAEGMISAGSAVFWDNTAKKATTVSGNNKYLGKTILAAEAGAEIVRVLLNSPVTLQDIQSTEAIASLTDNSGGTVSDDISAVDVGVRDAVASITAKVNSILGALRTVGIIPAE